MTIPPSNDCRNSRANPVDEFLHDHVSDHEKTAARSNGFSSRQQIDLDLWNEWQASGRKKESLTPLIKKFEGMIYGSPFGAGMYVGKIKEIPPAAIKAQFLKAFVKAVHTYDPKRGAALGTHVNSNLRRAKRFITTYQNPARIMEPRIYKITEYQNALGRLSDRLGRDPTTHELSDELGWSPRTVTTMRKEVRQAFSAPTGFESEKFPHQREAEKLRLVVYELSPDEKQVFEHVYGYGGRKELGTGAIAKKLKWSASKVSRLKKSIASKLDQY